MSGIYYEDLTREDVLVSETTRREPETVTFEEALAECRRAMAEEDAAAQRAREARRACLRLRPAGMTTVQVAHLIAGRA